MKGQIEEGWWIVKKKSSRNEVRKKRRSELLNGSIRIQLSGSTFPGGAKQIGEDKLKWCLSDKFKEKMHKSPFYCPTVLCDKKVINLVEITKQRGSMILKVGSMLKTFWLRHFHLLANGSRGFSIARKKQNPKTQGSGIGIPTPLLANGWIWFSHNSRYM